MNTNLEHCAIPDRDTSALLGNGYTIAWCIAPDGEPWPWLVANLCPRCEDAATHGSPAVTPAHERTGRLPREIREALGLVYRCGAPTSTRHGAPCRVVVAEPGQHCGAHRETARGPV